jgi:hypothetical protein
LDLFSNQFQIYYNHENIAYIYIDHFINIFELIKKNNFNSNKIILEKNSIFLENVLKIKAKIDYQLLEKFLKYKLKKHQFYEENLYDYQKKIIIEVKKAVKIDDTLNIIDFSKKLNEINDIIRISEIIKNKKNSYFYFPPLMCFRGRTHYTSSISFTLYKEFRYCLHGEAYTNFNKSYHPLNEKIENELSKHIHFLDKLKNFNFSKENINIKFSII